MHKSHKKVYNMKKVSKYCDFFRLNLYFCLVCEYYFGLLCTSRNYE